jgi:alpha,alpha-trehalose phosphorylase
MAAEVGYHEAAWDYFRQALYVDLANLHGNTVDGMHIASTGGVWSALVCGFGGMRDRGGRLSFDPRLPDAFPHLTFALVWRGTRFRVRLAPDSMTFTVLSGPGGVPISVRGEEHVLRADRPLVVDLGPDGARGTRLARELDEEPQLGGTRADGSRITAGVPDPIPSTEAIDDPADLVEPPPIGPHVPQS